MHLMLVEDEAPIVQSLLPFLYDLGHDVTAAYNGYEALASLEAKTFHVVLTDVKMPGIDGIELLTAIKQHSYGKALDVIVFTGHGTEDLAIRALRAGAFDYLKKPLRIEELVISLRARRRALAFANRK